MPTKEGVIVEAAANNVTGEIKSGGVYCYKYDGTNNHQVGECVEFTEVIPSTIPGCDEAHIEGPCAPYVEDEEGESA